MAGKVPTGSQTLSSGKGGDGQWGTWVMGTPVARQAPLGSHQTAIPVNYVPSPPSIPTGNPNYTVPAPPATVGSSTAYAGQGMALARSDNPYVYVSPVTGSSSKTPTETILKALGRCGKKFEDTARVAGGVAGNLWTHLKTGPSLTDAAMARLAHGTKVFAEGGHDKVFHQIFTTLPGERLQKAYACYLSTSSGPVIGTLYLTTARLAFCSDNPLHHYTSEGIQEWAYYKIVVPLDQLKAVNPSASRRNPAEKYIQVVTVDNNEFWFMGFVSYDKALWHLSQALQQSNNYHFHNQNLR